MRPHDLPAAEQASRYNILHICGGNVDVSRYLDFPCAVINFDVHENEITLKEGYERFGKTVLRPAQPSRPAHRRHGRSDSKGRARYRRSVRPQRGPDLRADCTLPPDVSYRRLARRWMRCIRSDPMHQKRRLSLCGTAPFLMRPAPIQPH
jgi:hypothetical protein